MKKQPQNSVMTQASQKPKQPTSGELRQSERMDKLSQGKKNIAMHKESQAYNLKNKAKGMRSEASKDSTYAQKLRTYVKSDSTAKAEGLERKSNYTKQRANANESISKGLNKTARDFRRSATSDSVMSQKLKGKMK